jgi:anti-sigma regulatory factor (Ser/Thr protein kinase)
MSSEEARGREADSSTESTGDSLAGEPVELKLPPRAQYLPVLRATLGVVAGSMSFDYDEIMQLRVAVSEAFELAIEHVQAQRDPPENVSLSVTFVAYPDRLEITVMDPGAPSGAVESAEDVESKVVIESLLDSVEFGLLVSGSRVTRMVIRKSRRGD